MTSQSLLCRDEQRRHKVRDAMLNGLDYVEVSEEQKTLTVYFLGKAPEQVTPKNILIQGGRRVRDIQVGNVNIRCEEDPELDDCMEITFDKPGDFSTYTLCMVALDEEGRPIVERVSHGCKQYQPLEGFDPRYACVEFTFKAGCPTDLDCQPQELCPPPERVEPEINYLAKDYASFRQLILDRLALIMPDWQERHVPDLGIALVELLAYVGDHLSYYQDAVGTEAYLDTARQRISVRRHTRLVDYRMHEGCNARTWVCVWTSSDVLPPALCPEDIYFITGTEDVLPASGRVLTPDDLRNIPRSHYEVFEPVVPVSERQDECESLAASERDKEGKTTSTSKPIQLYEAHNKILFYTWGDRQCCIPRGATTATLKDYWEAVLEPEPEAHEPCEETPPSSEPEDGQTPNQPKRKLHLEVGDVLIFEEVLGPKTGQAPDADPNHRHAVRITRVEPGVDELCNQPIVDIWWAEEDALPFPLCLSAIGPPPKCEPLENISVACGNCILVDHGETICDDPHGPVPLKDTVPDCGDKCRPPETAIVPGPFRPKLEQGPLTFSQPVEPNSPASTVVTQDPRQALPQIRLTSTPGASDGTGPLFHPNDLQDPTALALKVRAPKQDQTIRFLRGFLSTKTKEQLGKWQDTSTLPEDLRESLVCDLKKLCEKWTVKRDLLSSQGEDLHFVAEMDNDRHAHLRFGNGELGMLPQAGMLFKATYRIGNGPSGNVGAKTISHIVLRHKLLSGVDLRPRNPLPAQGGISPEALAEVKLFAPHTFRTELQRAIIAPDYARLAERHPKIQRAAATFRWTGSWYEVLVALDPLGQVPADQELLDEVSGYLYRYRRIGHDLRVAPAHYVPLDIKMTVCVLPHHLRGHVKAALLNLLSNRTLLNGRRGFFHPDNLSFGEGVFLSKLVATAQAVPGVENVIVDTLERLDEGPNQELATGILRLGALEIARLDNDQSFPEHGKLTLDVGGGR